MSLFSVCSSRDGVQGKGRRLSPIPAQRSISAVDRELGAYGAKQAKKLGVKEGDIPRIAHDLRARRRFVAAVDFRRALGLK